MCLTPTMKVKFSSMDLSKRSPDPLDNPTKKRRREPLNFHPSIPRKNSGNFCGYARASLGPNNKRNNLGFCLQVDKLPSFPVRKPQFNDRERKDLNRCSTAATTSNGPPRLFMDCNVKNHPTVTGEENKRNYLHDDNNDDNDDDDDNDVISSTPVDISQVLIFDVLTETFRFFSCE